MGEKMSDENTVPEGEDSGRSADNLKAEMDRKFQNLQKQNEELANQTRAANEALNTVLSKVNELNQPPARSKADDIDMDELKYTDPDRYMALKEQELEQKIISKVDQKTATEAEKNQTLNRLAMEFPALQDDSSELTQTALKQHDALPKNLQQTAAGYEIAIRRAADIVKQDAGSGNKGQGGSNVDTDDLSNYIGDADEDSERNTKSDSNALDPRTKAFAELISERTGKQIDLKKVAGHAKRRKKNWRKWK